MYKNQKCEYNILLSRGDNMDFDQIIDLVLLTGLILFIAPIVWKIINWKNESKKNLENRVEIIEENIKSIGGHVIKIEQTKKTECPYYGKLKDDGSVYVYYRVLYMIDGNQKEKWHVFNIRTNIIII